MPQKDIISRTIPDTGVVDRLTRHAVIRCQQRGISHQLVEIVYTYGRRSYNKGAEVRFMDKCSRRSAERRLGSEAYRQVANKLDFYIVISPDESILTVAHRNMRLKEKHRRGENGNRYGSNLELGGLMNGEDPIAWLDITPDFTDAS